MSKSTLVRTDNSGNVTLPLNPGRTYLEVYAITDTTVTIDGVTFLITAGSTWQPNVPPMNAMTIVGTSVTVLYN